MFKDTFTLNEVSEIVMSEIKKDTTLLDRIINSNESFFERKEGIAVVFKRIRDELISEKTKAVRSTYVVVMIDIEKQTSNCNGVFEITSTAKKIRGDKPIKFSCPRNYSLRDMAETDTPHMCFSLSFFEKYPYLNHLLGMGLNIRDTSGRLIKKGLRADNFVRPF